jgi:hypothetical protein
MRVQTIERRACVRPYSLFSGESCNVWHCYIVHSFEAPNASLSILFALHRHRCAPPTSPPWRSLAHEPELLTYLLSHGTKRASSARLKVSPGRFCALLRRAPLSEDHRGPRVQLPRNNSSPPPPPFFLAPLWRGAFVSSFCVVCVVSREP